MPALFTSTSMRPHLARIVCTSLSMSPRRVTSASMAIQSPPSAVISRSAFSSVSRSCTAVIATRAPSRANLSATARPMPRLPPVTIATCPSSLPIKVSYRFLNEFESTDFPCEKRLVNPLVWPGHGGRGDPAKFASRSSRDKFSVTPLWKRGAKGRFFSDLRRHRRRGSPIYCEIHPHANIKSHLMPLSQRENQFTPFRQTYSARVHNRTLIRNYAIAQLGRVCYEPFTQAKLLLSMTRALGGGHEIVIYSVSPADFR